MADLNPITIENFPEVAFLLSTDQMVLFTQQDGKTLPYVVQLSAFSEFLLSDTDLEELKNTVANLENKYRETELEFNRTYVTPKQVENEYSTIKNFDTKTDKIEKTEYFKSTRLNDKAELEYLDAKEAELLFRSQLIKRYMGAGNGSNEKWDGDGDDGFGYKIVMAGRAIGTKE